MRFILSNIYIVLYLIYRIPWMIYGRSLQKKDPEAAMDYAFKIAKSWARNMLWVAGADVHISGREKLPEETTVYVCNHQSFFDTPLLLSAIDRPFVFVAKKELESVPLLSDWMDLLGCVLIDRSDARKAIVSLKVVGERLESGRSAVIFPEGTRSRTGEIGEFKSGAFKTAFKHNVPVTPMVLNGTFRLYETDRGRIAPAKVDLAIFDPIPTEGMEKERKKLLGDEIKEELIKVKDSEAFK